ncbi:MAG: hypothetical protein EOP47_24475, partial [Sphingobacteriaceae bacterium]
MKSLKLLFAFCFFIPFLSFAQTNFNKGYVVNLQGDTTRGYIDFKQWGFTPKSIIFKETLTGSSKKIEPKNVTAFGINGFVYYKSAGVKISQGEEIIDRLTTEADTTTIFDNIFLKLVLSGDKVNLYSFKDSKKERFYVSESNGTP